MFKCMKPFILSFLAITCLVHVISQTEKHGTVKAGSFQLEYTYLNEEREPIHCEIPKSAEFPGGYDSLATYIKNQIKYPKTALKDSVEGLVEILFTINEQGIVEDVKLQKSVRKDLNEPCLNIVKNMPRWSPALNANDTIAMMFLLPIRFSLK